MKQPNTIYDVNICFINYLAWPANTCASVSTLRLSTQNSIDAQVALNAKVKQWLQSSAFNFTFTLTLTSGRQGGASNSLVPTGRCASAGLKLK